MNNEEKRLGNARKSQNNAFFIRDIRQKYFDRCAEFLNLSWYRFENYLQDYLCNSFHEKGSLSHL